MRDTGAGMPPAVAARAFEPFFTTKADAGRSGLGLSQVYGYARQSGGHTEIDSGTGGTTIRLLLPCSTEVAPVPNPVAAQADGAGETILVVEDTPLVRNAVTRMLGDLGYRVIVTPDAEQALNVIESDASIDLLFTDIRLPGALDGDELGVVARRLRPGLRVLCTSGYSQVRAEDLGDCGYRFGFIAKPYSKADLARQMRTVLQREAMPA